jgi:hypothetical protein
MPVSYTVRTAAELVENHRNETRVHVIVPNESAIWTERAIRVVDIPIFVFDRGLCSLLRVLGHAHVIK